MNTLSKEWLQFLREQYPQGSRIRLKEMNDPYHPVPPGTMGTLDCIDDIGTFHVKWDNGSSLGVVIGEDRFSVFPPNPTTLKLYMPLTADLFETDDYGDLNDDYTTLNGYDLIPYEDSIMAALVRERMPEESERGIMHWYHEEDTVNQKVRSVVFTVERREKQLWGVADCRVSGDLSPDELEILKEYIAGQASDGWGENFEQHEIKIDDSELYVHLWDFGNWSIQTEQERFTVAVAEGLPEACYSTLKSTGELICIKKGESGYYHSPYNTPDKKHNTELADTLNDQLGVTPEQRQAMEVGSMAGWDVPGADPSAYEKEEQQPDIGMQFE